jgi:uncharacterized membrane protein HdeD (DUF308 family)
MEQSAMLDSLGRHWWVLALRGVAALLFGLLALLWPGITLFALVLVFGAYVLADGVLTLVAAVRGREAPGDGPSGRGWLVAEGLAGIAIGVLALAWPGITALAALWIIAAWAVVTGVLEIVAAVRLRRELRREWLLALSGVLSVVFGVLLVVWPAAGVLALITLIGVAALAIGITLVLFSFRMRRHRADVPSGRHYGRPAAA